MKKYYYEKDGQVTSLQNMVANQRLSMSRTTLDDNEYAARFNRLNGAIDNISFNIRQHWKGIPPWLAPMVNKDAHKQGKKEMTAAGRACITRWVVDEIFDRYFHPCLEPELSSQLKIIERNIRRAGQLQVSSEEQRDDLTVKLTTWRLSTLEGLAESMAGEQGQRYKQELTANLVEELTGSLKRNLVEPPPPGLEDGVSVIIDLVIGLAAALPLESRDVCVSYYVPGTPISETYMRIEPTIPSLTDPGSNHDYASVVETQMQTDQISTHSGESKSENDGDAESNSNGNGGINTRGDSLHLQNGGNWGNHNGNGNQYHQLKKEDSRKKSIFGTLVGGGTQNTTNGNNGNGNSGNHIKQSISSDNGQSISGPGSGYGVAPASTARQDSSSSNRGERDSMDKTDRDRRIRFAAFVGVEVRGKGKDGGNVLVKAPCYAF